MKVKDLLLILAKADQEAEVVIEKNNNDGCGTCGYGETTSDVYIKEANDLESRIVLVPDY